jgi:hypothetical protein
MVGAAVSLATALVLSFVGLPATSGLVLLIGLLCGTILAGSIVGAKSVRRWAAAFGLVLIAQTVLWNAIIGLMAESGA